VPGETPFPSFTNSLCSHRKLVPRLTSAAAVKPGKSLRAQPSLPPHHARRVAHRALHAGARALVEEYDQLERSAQQTTKPHGRLKVSAPISFGLQLGPTLLDFARAYPDIGLDVSFTDRLVNLVDEGFDVAVRISTFADSSLIARKLANVGAVTVASPDYLARRGTPRTPGDLQDHDIILDTNVPNRHVWQYVRGKKRLDVGVDGRRISLLSRFVQKLLEQPAQFERRTFAAVAQDGRCDVALAIDEHLIGAGEKIGRIS
jgi:DNA-binding transcriptional LysR family regulator